MILNGKQKRYLRAYGSTLKTLLIIGKEGLTYNTFVSLEELLNSYELVKISLLKTCDCSLKQVAIELAAKSKAEIVQLIGRTLLLYRPKKDLKERKIILPCHKQ